MNEIDIVLKADCGGVLPTAPYQNQRVGFGAEIRMKYCGDNYLQFIEDNQKEVYKICYARFQSVAEQARIDLIKSQKANIRFYPVIDADGTEAQFPSVTSITNYDKTFDMPPEELQQYASQGNLADRQYRFFLKTGIWETDLSKIPDTFTDLAILKKGNLRLSPLVWNFPAFASKYITEIKEGRFCYSLKHRFAGTSDIRSCMWEGMKTLADIKRTPDRSQFRQLAGYVIAEEEMYPNEPPYEALMLISANPDNQQGFSKPLTTTEVSQCKAMFLDCRKEFQKLYLV